MSKLIFQPIKSFLYALILTLIPYASTASQHNIKNLHQEITLIKSAVEAFVYSNTANLPGQVTVSVGQIDHQLKLPKCPQLEAFVPKGNRLWGKTSIGVRCENQLASWTIYVQTEINVMSDVLHIARPITTGQTIAYDDVVFQSANLTLLPDSIFTDIHQVIGKVATTNLTAGQPFRPQMLRAPYVIQRGQSVNLVVQGKGFSIRSEGQALTDAAEGQVVQVRNKSGKIISGFARNNSIVEIQP
mgnify:CR=1 FL=1